MNFPLFSRSLLASLGFATLLLGTPAVLLARSTPPTTAATAPVPDATAAPTFYPVTDQTGRVEVSLTYQVAADNGPTGYSASGLPAGLRIDPASGLISGIPTEAGTFTATLSATNEIGVGTTTLTLVIAPALPVVTVASETAVGYPAQGINPTFLITRQGDTSETIRVTFFLKGSAQNGVDYQPLKLTKKLKAGKASKQITIRAADLSGQGITGKKVKLVLQPGENYTLGATTLAKVKIKYMP